MNNSVSGTHEPLKGTIQNPTYTRLSFLTNRKLKCSVEGVRSTPTWSLLLVLVRFPRSPQPRGAPEAATQPRQLRSSQLLPAVVLKSSFTFVADTRLSAPGSPQP